MTIYLRDAFARTGQLGGSAPDVSYNGEDLVWSGGATDFACTNGKVVPQASEGCFNQITMGAAYEYPPGEKLQAQFSVIVPAGLLPQDKFLIDVLLGVANQSFELYLRTNAAREVTLSMGAAEYPVTLVAGQTYAGEIVAGNGYQRYSFMGYVREESVGYGSDATASRLGLMGGSNFAVGPVEVKTFSTVVPPESADVRGQALAPSPLGSPAALARHDFSVALGDVISVYVMDLITPGGAVRVPISSWQATLRAGAASYVQCVVPACGQWMAAINAATEFVISRRAVLPGGQAIEAEMARAPAEQVRPDNGPQRYTCTISGYAAGLSVVADPSAAYDRILTGVRYVSGGITSGLLVRCAVDWLLRPGQRAWVNGTPFVVSYINYYSPSGFDSYMDVGQSNG